MTPTLSEPGGLTVPPWATPEAFLDTAGHSADFELSVLGGRFH